jgi:hypothetical protein
LNSSAPERLQDGRLLCRFLYGEFAEIVCVVRQAHHEGEWCCKANRQDCGMSDLAEHNSLQSSLSLMVSLSNHEPQSCKYVQHRSCLGARHIPLTISKPNSSKQLPFTGISKCNICVILQRVEPICDLLVLFKRESKSDTNSDLLNRLNFLNVTMHPKYRRMLNQDYSLMRVVLTRGVINANNKSRNIVAI